MRPLDDYFGVARGQEAPSAAEKQESHAQEQDQNGDQAQERDDGELGPKRHKPDPATDRNPDGNPDGDRV